MSKNPLIKDVDYYLTKEGMMVFTESYHLKRGHCCQSGCLHCPFGFTKKTDPNVPAEFQSAWSEEDLDFSSDDEDND